MKNIAFKRAKTAENTKNSLHPDYIVEYADTTLFPEGFHKPEEGYEILSEEMFQEELSKNEQLHLDFLDKKEKDDADRIKTMAAMASQEEAQERKDKREYEEFLKWKKMKGKR